MVHKSKVFLFRYDRSKENVLSGLRKLMERSEILDMIHPGDSVAVKLHMGELGNIRYLRPILVRRVVDLIKSRGANPFLVDTTTLYRGKRSTPEDYLRTAASHGFTPHTMGAPILICNGSGIPVSIHGFRGCKLRQIWLASEIAQADFLLVLSHFKGHVLTGFGGAIKNLGMGCVLNQSKRDQHAIHAPIFKPDNCTGCCECVDACPQEALKMQDGIPVRDPAKCASCGRCISACHNGAWIWPNRGRERLQIYLAHAAAGVLRSIGRYGFLNFIQDLCPECDCSGFPSNPILPDIGIAASLDPVAIDKASMDLVDQQAQLARYRELNPPDVFGKLHGIDSMVQLRAAKKLGLGNLEYILELVS